MEFKTRKEIIYHINRETVCTYEMDDTPPFELNEEALDIAIGIALMYQCNMVDEIHIARKQYLDGSIPTGFQRTTIVGVNGRLPYRDRQIQVTQLASRGRLPGGQRRRPPPHLPHRPAGHAADRDRHRRRHAHPQEVADVAEIIRRLARSTGRVRTGIGAARQDVNVSVTGGTRIEIKGVPRIPAHPAADLQRGHAPVEPAAAARRAAPARDHTGYFLFQDRRRHPPPAQDALPAGPQRHRRGQERPLRHPGRLPRAAALADPDRHLLSRARSPTASGWWPA